MKSNKRSGVILNVITSESLDTANYTIGNKAMIAGLTQNWAKELKHFDVRVGSIVPISYQETNTSAPLSLSMQYEMVEVLNILLKMTPLMAESLKLNINNNLISYIKDRQKKPAT